MKEICCVKQKHESSDGCLKNRLVSLTLPAIIDPSYFPIARMNPTISCFPEFFLYLAAEFRRHQFHVNSLKPTTEKDFLEICPHLRSNLQFQRLVYSEMSVPLYTIPQSNH